MAHPELDSSEVQLTERASPVAIELRRRRALLRISQVEALRWTGAARTVINEIERGKPAPSLPNLAGVAPAAASRRVTTPAASVNTCRRSLSIVSLPPRNNDDDVRGRFLAPQLGALLNQASHRARLLVSGLRLGAVLPSQTIPHPN
jgi:DNA-binding XRE family transcriptional regulator